MVQDVTPFGLKLDVKRILLVWSEKKKDYVTEMELEEEAKKRIDDSAQYAFTLVRPVKPSDYQGSCWVDIRIHVRSQYFVKAAKVVMKAQRNVAWEANPVKVSVASINISSLFIKTFVLVSVSPASCFPPRIQGICVLFSYG